MEGHEAAAPSQKWVLKNVYIVIGWMMMVHLHGDCKPPSHLLFFYLFFTHIELLAWRLQDQGCQM